MERSLVGALRSFLRRNRLLLVAIAISLLLHFALATRMNFPFAPPEDKAEVVRIDRVRVLRVAKQPTPPPQTPPPLTPSPGPSASASAAPQRHGKPGDGTQTVASSGASSAPVATAAPTPHPSPTSTCSGADTPVAVASQPPYPEIPANARGAATNAATRVNVSVNADGIPQSATVAASSGNSSLDEIALSLAKQASYTAATHQCKPVTANVVVSFKFSPW